MTSILYTGKMKKPRTITVFPMPETERVVKLVNEWGKRSKREEVETKLQESNDTNEFARRYYIRRRGNACSSCKSIFKTIQ